jgi:hypothetical protein
MENIEKNNTNNNNINEKINTDNNYYLKIREFLLEKLFFIIGAFLLIIGLGYSIIEFIKDIKVILFLVFTLGLSFIVLPYKYKEKLNNFFFIGLQVIGIIILYTDAIVSSLIFNIFPLIYSLIIVFGISLLSLILSLKNRSQLLMVLSSAGAYLSILFPDIPLNFYINKYLLFITLINLFMSLSFYIFKWMEMRIINFLFFIISVIGFFGTKGLDPQFIPLIIIFLTINYILFYFNFNILLNKLNISDLIYFIILNLIYWSINIFFINSKEFNSYLNLANIPPNIISFIFSFIFSLFLALNYYIYRKKKENENVLYIFYSMVMLFSVLTIQTLFNNIYWFIIWLTISLVYTYIYSLNKNQEYKSFAISSYLMFIINLIPFLLYYTLLDLTRIISLITVFILNILIILIMSKIDNNEHNVYLHNLKHFPIFLISFILPLIIFNYFNYLNIDINIDPLLLSLLNFITIFIITNFYIYKFTNSIFDSFLITLLAGIPLICYLLYTFYIIMGENYIYITTIFIIILILPILNEFKLFNYKNYISKENSPIFNFLSLNLFSLMLVSIIFPTLEIIISKTIFINKIYLFILIYSIFSIISLIIYLKNPSLFKYLSNYSISIFYFLLLLFLIHLLYPLFDFENYHYTYSNNNILFLNLRTLSYIILAFSSMLFYYLYTQNESLKNNKLFNMINRNSILTTLFVFLILIIQEIYDISFKLKTSEFISNLIVLIIITIYGLILLYLSNKNEKLTYLKDSSLITLSLAIIITTRSYIRNVEYLQILLVIMGINFILFAILFNPQKNKITKNV